MVESKTDPNSLYRTVFSRDLDFFLYVFDHTDSPFQIKLHIDLKSPNEVTSGEL